MSTGGQTNVDAAALTALIGQVDAALRETSRAVSRVEGVRGQVSSHFRGGASPTFDRNMQAWCSRAAEIGRDLQRIHGALQQHQSTQNQLSSSTQSTAGSWAR